MSYQQPLSTIWTAIRMLKKETNGKGIKIAILDGSIDTKHPAFATARIKKIRYTTIGKGHAVLHGTHVASILLANNVEKMQGVCPEVEVYSIPIFRENKQGQIIPSSQLDLARAIERCTAEKVLVVSAAGNDGCACFHAPAVHPSVLAVGALSNAGEPMDFSNWGKAYQLNGVMAPGERIMGATPDGAYHALSGTSFATPIVSGIIALLLSYGRTHFQESLSALDVKEAILDTVFPCSSQTKCERYLKGVINVQAALEWIQKKYKPNKAVDKIPVLQSGSSSATKSSHHAVLPSFAPVKERQENTKKRFVYALGTLGIDYDTQATFESFRREMKGIEDDNCRPIQKPNPQDPRHIRSYLKKHPTEASRLTWVIKQHGSPSYAIKPSGDFNAQGYQKLAEYLKPLTAEERVRMNFCSIPGEIIGETKLRTGQRLPLIHPFLQEMQNWKTRDLCAKVVQINSNRQEPPNIALIEEKVQRFIHRLSFQLTNKGAEKTDRALNYVTSRFYTMGSPLAMKLLKGYELEYIRVEKSSFCRPDSDCQDVTICFFQPKARQKMAKHLFRFTVDVSQPIPILMGTQKDWYAY